MKPLNEEQREKLKEITNKLRQVREEKSIHIEEIAAKILVRPVFLSALEEGRFEELPEAVYIQGFIRRYGDILGLDGTGLGHEFGSIACPPPIPQENSNLGNRPNIHIPLAVPYILLIIGASLGLFYLLSPKPAEQAVSQSQYSSNVSEEKNLPESTTSSSAAVPKPTPTPTLTPIEGVKVSLDAQAESWVRVTTDEKKVFEGTLQKGDKKSFTAKEKLTIRSGNPAAVMIGVNQSQPVPLGSDNNPKTATYTSEGVE
ncbi:MAG: helix-turn-helix domain-containing protein [Richelia sp. RM2_1_2]|nr:helix-turn-helix domain-containing protein [Richelia sp. SM2_1_7]NJM19196.1 helix-turn-helix domain-containing protein [Richelia sp. SM1_7_0]NJN06940.1 helix-turn-helix domain-containing protein [Richelia sp. RM1_1_1]NJO26215.1 helix-turn-helix domain-containing protein [Richelia sp. SL_2_1]NJO58087.1 helix-turn-helix domain-containing protein [Richelia sp. RM2_1_2]